MDPKFDSGVHPERGASLDVYSERGLIPQKLSPQQMLAIMDRLVACEVLQHIAAQLILFSKCGLPGIPSHKLCLRVCIYIDRRKLKTVFCEHIAFLCSKHVKSCATA